MNRAVFNRVSNVILVLLWLCISSLCDHPRKLAPLSQPMRSKTKTINRELQARIFPRFASAACNCFVI